MTGSLPVGVLVMAHGTPESADELEAFYTSIRRGRPPTRELLAELADRYAAIGGLSPLTEITRAQVAALRAELDRRSPGRFLVGFGAKHVEPRIERGLADLVAAGARRIVGIVLTPHASTLGAGSYLERAQAAADASSTPAGDGVELVPVPGWHRVDGFARLLAERTEAALSSLDAPASSRVSLFFTAHSLPVTAAGGDDLYAGQVAETAEDVVRLLGLRARPGLEPAVAWQSAGRAPGPWLGPALLDEIERVADHGATAVVVCPAGFVADHLEVLYDLDIEAAGRAAARNMAFARTASLNDDPRFAAVLADAVEHAVGGDLGSATATAPDRDLDRDRDRATPDLRHG